MLSLESFLLSILQKQQEASLAHSLARSQI